MSTTKIEGQLEIDSSRGVIYFHTSDKDVADKIHGVTVLRICQLPTPIPDNQMLDITFGHGCDWCDEKNVWQIPMK